MPRRARKHRRGCQAQWAPKDRKDLKAVMAQQVPQDIQEEGWILLWVHPKPGVQTSP